MSRRPDLGREETNAGGTGARGRETWGESRARVARVRASAYTRRESTMDAGMGKDSGKATRTAAEDQVVAVIPKGPGTEVRAVLREYEGELLAELRTFVRTSGEWVPTARGVALPVERAAELAEAAEALAQAVKV
jgi:hypothetical protein